jgi:hydroxyethylthiazole kinase-like uncharacterized protein yjeF
MLRAVTRAEMAEIDRRANLEFAIPTLLLMENAGLRSSDIARAEFAEGRCDRIVVVCGRGNNGGDGFVAARHLSNAGLPVEVFYCGDPQRVRESSDPGRNAEILRRMGLAPRSLTSAAALDISPRALVVDALFGTGLRSEVRGLERDVIGRIVASGARVLAIDVPSGLDADEGVPLGVAVRATTTVALGLPKRGFFLRDGPAHAGKLVVADISLPRPFLESAARVTE